VTRDLGRAEQFIAGAVGEPGSRVFYLQVAAGKVVWFVLEKLQVAALAAQALELLDAAFPMPEEGTSAHLDPPDEVLFRVGTIKLASAQDQTDVEIELGPAGDTAGDGVRFTVAPELLEAMARSALVLVESGRPLCPRCGLAMESEGHACPTGNGDLRDHRP